MSQRAGWRLKRAGWSWVEVEMSRVEVEGVRLSWVKVDGAGWRWIHGLVIPYNIAILEIKSADYRCTIRAISKSEAIQFLQKIDLAEKKSIMKI